MTEERTVQVKNGLIVSPSPSHQRLPGPSPTPHPQSSSPNASPSASRPRTGDIHIISGPRTQLEISFNVHQPAESSKIEMLTLDSLHERDIKTNRTRSEGRRIDVSASLLHAVFYFDLPRCNV